MAKKSLIYLSNDGLVIYQWDENTLREVIRLEDAENAREPLTHFFASKKNDSFKLFLDILEESYSLESLPHLGAGDRKAITERRKRQLFPKQKYVYSEYKGRGNSDRRDDLILFSAISKEQAIKQWLQVLFEIKVSISGIYSASLLLESFAQQLEGKQNKLILSFFSNQQGTFVRQCFFKDNVFTLSRFRQINSFNPNKIANEIREDVNRTQHFIAQQFKFSTENNLSVFFFGSGFIDLTLFEQIDFSSIALKPEFQMTDDYALSQGDVIENDCSLSLYIAAKSNSKKQSKVHYKDELSQFYYRHLLLKKGLNIASLLLLLFSIYCIGVGFFQYTKLTRQADQLQIKKINVSKELLTSPEIPLFKGYDPFELFEQLETQQKINKQAITPLQIMSSISWSLQAFPDIKLTKLEWGKESNQTQKNSGPIALGGMPGDPAQTNTANVKRSVKMILEAKIEPFEGDYRYALALIERFSQHLSNDAQIDQVVANSLPVNISSDNELSGAIQKESKKIHNRFILEMNWLR